MWASHCSDFSWASLIAQLVKNLPAVQETWLRSLGQEDPLEKDMATHSQFSCLENPMNRQHVESSQTTGGPLCWQADSEAPGKPQSSFNTNKRD